jgi:aspartyl-tRNA(Asn)/glutamyl-tRNA(Gln) amidotransferase subunit B
MEKGTSALRRQRLGAAEGRGKVRHARRDQELNSFRFAKMAIDYEIARQVTLIERAGRSCRRRGSTTSRAARTVGMRSKEHAHDYRYFPEPDLVPLRVSEQWLAEVKIADAELPAKMRARFVESYGLREYDAQALTQTRAIA